MKNGMMVIGAALLLMSCVAQRVVTYQGVKSQSEIVLKYRGDAYKSIGIDLVGLGYVIESKDEEFGQIVTSYATAANPSLQVQVLAMIVDDTTVKLSGRYTVSSLSTSVDKIERHGMGGSIAMQAWNELVYVAKNTRGVIE